CWNCGWLLDRGHAVISAHHEPFGHAHVFPLWRPLPRPEPGRRHPLVCAPEPSELWGGRLARRLFARIRLRLGSGFFVPRARHGYFFGGRQLLFLQNSGLRVADESSEIRETN